MAISLAAALEITKDSNRPFQIKYVTYDRNRGTGGELIELTEAVRIGSSHNQRVNNTINVKQLNAGHHPHTVHAHLILEVNNQEIYI